MSLVETLKSAAQKLLSIQEIKAQILSEADNAVELAEKYVAGEGQEKKEIALAYIMSKLTLPLWLKPFKGVIKSILSNFLDKVIEDALNLLKAKVATAKK